MNRMRQARRRRRVAAFPQTTSHRPRAGSKTPTPSPPPREGDFVRRGTAGRGRSVGYKLHVTSHKPRTTTTSHKLQATCRPFPIPGRGRTRRPRSGVHAARTAKTLSLPSSSPLVTLYGPSRSSHHAPQFSAFRSRCSTSIPTPGLVLDPSFRWGDGRGSKTPWQLLPLNGFCWWNDFQDIPSSFQPNGPLARASRSRPEQPPLLVES